MNNYLQARESIRKEVDQLPIISRAQWHYQFAAFSASLRWLMPDVPNAQHEQLFRLTLLNQRWANLDEYFFNELSVHWQGENNTMPAPIATQPSVVCTYHLGSYRLLPHWLIAQGVSICMLLASEVLDAQGEGMLKLAGETSRRNGATCSLIDAQHPAAGLRMLSALRQGKTVLAYLDGNAGALANDESANVMTIPFLKGELRVRTGLAALAHVAGVPLYSVVSEPVDRGAASMRCLRFIQPCTQTSRSDFAQRATEILYNDLQHIVKQQPWKWENWLSIHEQLY